MSTPRFGVIVLNWGRPDDTVACLESLQRASPAPARIVVLDNGSPDDSVARLRAWSGQRRLHLDLLTAERNLGFAGGNNMALRHLARDPRLTHFLLLNNDATVAPDLFAALATALDRFPDAALLSPTVYWASAPDVPWYAGGRFALLRAVALHDRPVRSYMDPRSTEFVTGCAMLISRPALDALGPLPECYYPGYMEDVEYSYRARALGLAVVYAPAGRVYHKVSATAATASGARLVAFAFNKHRVLFARRNLSGWTRYAALTYLACVKPVQAVWESIRGRPLVGAAVLRGVAAGFLDVRRDVPSF